MNFLAVPYEKDGEVYDRYTDPDYIAWLKAFRELGAEGYLRSDIFLDKRMQMEEVGLYETMFAYSLDDIAAMPPGRPVIAEGAGFLPHLMRAAGADQSHFVCVVPTREFQIKTYSGRDWIHHFLAGSSDEDQAFDNWMERDALLGARVLRDAEELGYPHLIVDGVTGIEANCAWVETALGLSERFTSN